MMTDLIAILLGVVMVNGFVLPAFPMLFAPAAGIAPGTALPRLALLTPAVVAPSSALAVLVGRGVLAPLRLAELQPLAIILATVLAAQLAGLAREALRRDARPVPRSLLTFNSVAAGLALDATLAPAGPLAALLAGAATGAALGLLNLCFAGLRERLDAADLPAAWRGAGIALVTAGILSLGLGGLAGIWRG